MKTGNLFCLELAAAFADRRRTVLRLGVTLLLALPFVAVRMPARAQVGGLAMVIVFTTLMGGTVAQERLYSSERLARLLVLPLPRALIRLDLLLARTLNRFVVSAPLVLAYLLIQGRPGAAGAMPAALGMLAATLALLTALAMGIARAARSGGEAHLFAALGAGAVAILGGLVPLPERLARWSGWVAWNPVRQLADALAAGAQGQTVPESVVLTGMAVLIVVAAVWVGRWMQGQR